MKVSSENVSRTRAPKARIGLKYNGPTWLLTATFALTASLASVFAPEVQAQSSEAPEIGTTQRVPSSQVPIAPSVDPTTLPPHRSPNAWENDPFVPGPRNPFAKSDPSLQIGNPGSNSSGDAPSGVDELSIPDVVFNGLNTNSGPPGTVGDVGPNHYIHMVNSGVFQVFEHDGTATTGPTNLDSLWPTDDDCANGWGDPIVVYDHLADRWLMTQFAWAQWSNATPSRPVAPYFLCFALSTTGTPDAVPANWYLWTVNAGTVFPDYPKLGVWPDAY